ncbi:NUDIX hydrolase [Glycomyces sp. NPDC047010]|uniref:NUDIX hydrolase n=1 Tax=Glycomyces sp. NPDC047010 TaxID=3155023 RepID=UPI003401DC47
MEQVSSEHDSPLRRARAFAASAALIRNPVGDILMVQPTYKEPLELPGGYVEVGESPVEACLREVREELGIEIALGGLLVVDWAPAPSEGDKILFAFDGGQLSADQEADIKLRESEVSSWGYYPLSVIEARTPARLFRRIAQAAQADSTRYLEDGGTAGVTVLPRRPGHQALGSSVGCKAAVIFVR